MQPIALEAQLAQQLDDVRGRLAALEQWRQSFVRPTTADVLGEIARVVRGRVFTAGELDEYAAIDAELRRVLGACSVRQLGNRLRRLNGKAAGGLVLRNVTRVEAGCIWTVDTC